MASIDRRTTRKGEVRYDVRYRGLDDTQLSRTWRTRKDAQRFAATVEADKLRGAWVDPRRASRTFEDVASEWLNSNPAKRSSSYARDESAMRVHRCPQLGLKPIGSITSVDLRETVAELSRTLKARSVRRVFGVASEVFHFAVESEILISSPCKSEKLPAVHITDRHVVNAKQLARLASSMDARYRLMVYLGAVGGLRWGECAAVRVGNVDLVTCRVHVVEQVTRGYKGAHSIGPPKSEAGRRTVSLPQWLIDLTIAHLVQAGVGADDHEALLFPNSDGGLLRYEHWRRRIWLPATEAAGLGGLTFHDLRRANAYAMVNAGVDLKTAQTRLGHSDPRLTLAVYAQATSAPERAAAEVIGDHFLPQV